MRRWTHATHAPKISTKYDWFLMINIQINKLTKFIEIIFSLENQTGGHKNFATIRPTSRCRRHHDIMMTTSHKYGFLFVVPSRSRKHIFLLCATTECAQRPRS
jgi:hypothetical protein